VGLVTKDRGVSLDGLGVERLHSKPSMLSPDRKKVIYQSRTSFSGNLPFIIIWGRGDSAATKYGLTLDVIWLATREDCTIGNQQIFRNACVRNYNK
jgi:hypothetical protein